MTPEPAYPLRAGNRPLPAVSSQVRSSGIAATARAQLAADYEVFADVSEHQGKPIDEKYPYSIFSFRLDTGSRLDRLAAANLLSARRMLDAARLSLLIGYVVLVPDANTATMGRLAQLLGTHCPAGLAFRVDVESGADFAGPGDHSRQANDLVARLADYAGDPRRVEGYANASDLASCWPTRPAGLKVCVAHYGGDDPGGYGQQYYGGLDYPSPAGLPRTCPPWGTWVDLNVIRRPLGRILEDYGIRRAPVPSHDWLDMATKDEVFAIVRQQGNHPICMKFVGCGAKNNEHAVYMLTEGRLLLLNGRTYTSLGTPPVRVQGPWSTFWTLPVVPGTTDLRGK